jgi:hypothetical protein
MKTPWWLGVDAAEGAVACGPNHHRLRWRDGALIAMDHPDPTAEAMLSEMGGDEPTCLRLLRYWHAHSTDPRLLVLAGRHPGDTVIVTADDLARAERALDQADGAPAPFEDRLALLSLLDLDPSLQRRLQLQVAAYLADLTEGADQPAHPSSSSGLGPSDPDPDGTEVHSASAGAVLEAATVGRLVPVVRRWAPEHRVEVAIGPPGVKIDERGTVVVTAGWRWLADAWGKYLASVNGFLVLEVHRIIEDRAVVTGWGAPNAAPARLTLRGPAPWRVIDRAEPPPP